MQPLTWRHLRLVSLWLPVFAYMGLIWFLSSQSRHPALLAQWHCSDKLLHGAAFALLAFLWVRALCGTARRVNWRLACFAWGITVLWGLLDELHQAFVPGRDADILDWCADSLGGCLGVLAYLAWQHRRPS